MSKEIKQNTHLLIRKEIYERLKWHKDRGDKVVLVSASIKDWLSGWCQKEDIELISTEISFLNGTILYKTNNCYGIEKANRIRDKFNLDNFGKIYAYGDSNGDREMLKLADEGHMV